MPIRECLCIREVKSLNNIFYRLFLGQFPLLVEQKHRFTPFYRAKGIGHLFLSLKVTDRHDPIVFCRVIRNHLEGGISKGFFLIVRIEQVNLFVPDTCEQHIMPAVQIQPDNGRTAPIERIPQPAVLG